MLWIVTSLASSATVTQAIVFLVTLILAYRWLTTRKYNLPPGPRGLPLLGNFLEMRSSGINAFHHITRWHKEYGKILTFSAGRQKIVVLNDIDLLKEAFCASDHNFTNKSQAVAMGYLTRGGKDIALAQYSPALVFRRKLAMQALREYMTDDQLGERVNEALTPNMDSMLAKKGAFDPHEFLCNTVINIITKICFGKDHDTEDPNFKMFLHVLDSMNDIFGLYVEDVFPLLSHCPTPRFRRTKRHIDAYLSYIQKHWNENSSSFDPDNITNLTQNVLLALKKMEDNNEPFPDFNTDTAIQIMSDVFFAGVDTTRQTLRWVVLVFALYPKLQEKVHDEVADIIGEAMPSRRHRSQLVYTEAFLMEVMRMFHVAPFGLAHLAIHDSKLAGYDIPANTQVLANYHAIMRDPKHWDQPEEFLPERFLDETGKALKPRHQSWTPFSLGPRNCIGEFLAKQELIYLMAGIIKKVKVSLPEGETVDLSPTDDDMTYLVKPYKVVFTLRTAAA